jgi:hypothetical protein
MAGVCMNPEIMANDQRQVQNAPAGLGKLDIYREWASERGIAAVG